MMNSIVATDFKSLTNELRMTGDHFEQYYLRNAEPDDAALFVKNTSGTINGIVKGRIPRRLNARRNKSKHGNLFAQRTKHVCVS